MSQRFYRAERVSDWVEAVLAGDADEASRLMEHLTHYPIVMTRDLGRARQRLR